MKFDIANIVILIYLCLDVMVYAHKM